MPLIDKIKYDNDSYEIADNRDLPREFWMNSKLYGKLWVHNNLTSLDLNNNYYQYNELNGFNNGTGMVSNGIYSNSDTWNGRINSLVDAGNIKGGLGVGLTARSLNKTNNNYINNNFWIAETIDGKPYYYITNPQAFRRDIRNNNTFKKYIFKNTDFNKNIPSYPNSNIKMATLSLLPGNWIVTAWFRFKETNTSKNKGARVIKIVVDPELLTESVPSTESHFATGNGGGYINTQRLIHIPTPESSNDWWNTTNVYLVAYQDSNETLQCNAGYFSAAMI